MRFLFSLLLLVSTITFGQKQEGFVGKLTYSVQIVDTGLQTMIPVREMVIYTNDTLLRIENETDQLGMQVVIKHMALNKSYLLLHTPVANYAIQTDHNTEKVDTFPYTFKKKFGRTKICGWKAKKLMVKHANFTEEMEFLYFKNLSAKYLNTLENFPGLPVKYYISSVDGTYLYQLTAIDRMDVEKDYFGIPSDFKKVTFDQFVDEMLIHKEQQEKERLKEE